MIRWLVLCVAVGGCGHGAPAHQLPRLASATQPRAAPEREADPVVAEPMAAPAPMMLEDELAQDLRSPDETVRYMAAARAFEKLEPAEVSAAARDALLELVSNPNERGGIRLWAARAAAKVDPPRALRRFIELGAEGVAVDGDAWLILGPLALPHLASRCTAADCPETVFFELALIAGSAPTHRESRAVIPLLLRESARSEQRKVMAYRALGGFGPSVVQELEALRRHDDPTIANAAAEALAAVREVR
jgi:hypothetical protein